MANTALQDSGGRSVDFGDVLSPPGAPVWVTGVTVPTKIQPQDETAPSTTHSYAFMS